VTRFVLAVVAVLSAAVVAFYYLGPPRNGASPQAEGTAAVVPAGDDQRQEEAASRLSQAPSAPPFATNTKANEPQAVGEPEHALPEAEGVIALEAAAIEPAPQFDVVRVEPSGSLIAAGRASPGSLVELRSGDLVLDRVEADERGEWVMLPETHLPVGDHELELLAHLDGNEHRGAGAVVISLAPTLIDSAQDDRRASSGQEPEEEAPASAVAGAPEVQAGPLAVLLPDDLEEAPLVLQGPREGLTVGELTLESLSYDRDGQLTIDGRVTPGRGRVFVYIDNEYVDRASGDDAGRWRSQPEEPVAEGLHHLRLDQVDGAGRVLARLETPFVRSDFVGGLSAEGRFVVVQPGNSLWRIARGSYGRGIQYTLIFEANRDQIRDADLIYPGQIFLIPGEG